MILNYYYFSGGLNPKPCVSRSKMQSFGWFWICRFQEAPSSCMIMTVNPDAMAEWLRVPSSKVKWNHWFALNRTCCEAVVLCLSRVGLSKWETAWNREESGCSVWVRVTVHVLCWTLRRLFAEFRCFNLLMVMLKKGAAICDRVFQSASNLRQRGKNRTFPKYISSSKVAMSRRKAVTPESNW